MKRRDFLRGGACLGAAAVAGGAEAVCARAGGGCGGTDVPLNLGLNWWSIPTADDANAKLDFLEENGFAFLELPTGQWLFDNGEKLKKALAGRRVKLSAACGPSDFSYAEKEKREAEVAKFLPQLEMLGFLGSTGLILCPARGTVAMGFAELRKDFVENTGRRLAEAAHKAGTSIILEPLRRNETPFLRQVADAAQMAKEMGPGATVLGDFWHMALEEPSLFGAFVTAGKLLTHVHIASLRNRSVPGTDGACDDYRDGFKGLKCIGYAGPVSMECGWPWKGKDGAGKPIPTTDAEKKTLLKNMSVYLRNQWKEV